MADLEELIKALRNTADELEEEIPLLLIEQEVSAISLVQDRIQETGKDSKGGKLGDYSNTKVPAFFFIGKGTKATDAKLKRLAKDKKLISYAEFRKLDGKQNDYVDLTFTGQMFRETGLVQKQTSKTNSVIIIGQKSQRSEKVAGYNEKRYGNFLALSEEELEIITEDIEFGVTDILQRNLSGL